MTTPFALPRAVEQELGKRNLQGASLLDFSRREIKLDDTLLGNRFLCRGGGCFIIAPSGHGKSTLAVQAAIEFAVGHAAFGIQANGALRSLIIQAEDDEGDTIEMARIVDHLNLSEEQKELVERNTWIEFVNDLTGQDFLDALDGFLEQWPADLVWINPYTAYLGSDIKDDGANSRLLRSGLNLILTKHRCAAIVVHHTPKINFRDTTKWRLSDWMYAGAGAAVLTNWARAVFVFDPTTTPGVYRFIAAKRGNRIGWPSSEQFFSHSREDGKLLWVPSSYDEIASATMAPKQPGDLFDLIPNGRPISQADLRKIAKEKLGIGEKKCNDFVNTLANKGLITRHKIKREGTKSAVGYARSSEPSPESLGF